MRLYQEGVKVVAIPKPWTTCSRNRLLCRLQHRSHATIQMTNDLRTYHAGSHERFLVLEVFQPLRQNCTAITPDDGRSCFLLIGRFPSIGTDIDQLTELLVADRRKNPSRYSVVLVSGGCHVRRR